MSEAKREVWVAEDNGLPTGVCIHLENVTPEWRPKLVRYVPAESAQPAERAGEWVTCVPRASVRWFAEQMELALRRNDDKGGWHECEPEWLIDRAREELDELFDEACEYEQPESSISEAADVANMVMMVADHYREGGPSIDQGHTLSPPQKKPTDEGGRGSGDGASER